MFPEMHKYAKWYDAQEKMIAHPITEHMISRLYELEYKIYKLESLNSSRPSTLKTIERLREELNPLIKRALVAMKEVFNWWVNFHSELYDEVSIYEKAKTNYPEIEPRRLQRAFSDYMAGTATKYDEIFRKYEQEARKELWQKPPFDGIYAMYKELQKNAENGDMTLFQRALTTVHQGGPMVNHFSEKTGVSIALLSDLSDGKFIKTWDKEIEKFAKERLISKRASDMISWWLSPSGELHMAADGHRKFIEQHSEWFGCDPDIGCSYENAFNNGWWRIAKTYSFLSFNIPGQLSDADVRKMQAVLEKLPSAFGVRISDDKHTYDIKYSVLVGAESMRDIKSFSAAAEQKSPLSKRAFEPMLSWWLSPDDELIKVDKHTEFVAHHPEIFGRPDYDNGIGCYDLAAKQGWIRIGTYSGSLTFDVGRMGPGTFIRIKNVIDKLPKTKKVDIYSNNVIYADDIDYDTFVGATDLDEIRTLKFAHISKRAKKDSAGVFIVLPEKIGKQFPSLGKHDDSKPHITALYVGHVPKSKQKTIIDAVEKVAAEQKPIELELDDKVTYFEATDHSDDCKVAKIAIKPKALHDFHEKLKKAIDAAGIEIDDHFPDYKPHVTLEYLPPDQDKYDGDIPAGKWDVTEVEIWGCGNKKTIKFGKKSLSKRNAARSEDSFDIHDDIKAIMEEYKRNPVVKKETFTKTKQVELWHGVRSADALQKLPNGKYLLTPKPGPDLQKLWFVPAWSNSSKETAIGYATHALIKVKIDFEFEYEKATKKDGNVSETLVSYKPITPKWERSYQVQEWYLHDGALEVDQSQITPFEEVEETLISLQGSARSISKRADNTSGWRWWLSPDDKVHEVGFLGHWQFIADNPELFGQSAGKTPSYEMAFARGWIRISKMNDFMSFDVPGKLSDSSLRRVQLALEKLPAAQSVRVADYTKALDVPYSLLLGAQSISDLRRNLSACASVRLSNRLGTMVEHELPSKITAYHCGQALVGDKFSLDYFGSGEASGGQISATSYPLGKGIYFNTNKNLAARYAKYVQNPIMYEVEIDTSNLYDSARGIPMRIREKVLNSMGPDFDGLSYADQKTQREKVLNQVGVTGRYEQLPHGIEIAVYDLSIVKILHADKLPVTQESSTKE